MPDHGREPHRTLPSDLFLSHSSGLHGRRNQNAYLEADIHNERGTALLYLLQGTQHHSCTRTTRSLVQYLSCGANGWEQCRFHIGRTSPGSRAAASPSPPANPPQATPESPATNSGQARRGASTHQDTNNNKPPRDSALDMERSCFLPRHQRGTR